MKIKLQLDESIEEDEIIIKIARLDTEAIELQKAINELLVKKSGIIFYKGDTEYYFSIDKVLFFETEQSVISAHTVEDLFQVKHKLYELEEILPSNFLRISKSTIINVKHIYSISKNLTASSLVKFHNTHKQVYVSRYYYKPLKNKLLEKGN